MIDDGVLVFDERGSQILSGLDVPFGRLEGLSELRKGRDAMALVLYIALLVFADEAVACVGGRSTHALDIVTDPEGLLFVLHTSLTTTTTTK